MNSMLRLAHAALALLAVLGAWTGYQRLTENKVIVAARDDAGWERSDSLAKTVKWTERRSVMPSASLPEVSMDVEPQTAAAEPEPVAEIVAEDVLPEWDSAGGPPLSLVADPQVWLAGRRTFKREWTAAEGLGAKSFNEKSCGACHHDPALGGAGANEFNVGRGRVYYGRTTLTASQRLRLTMKRSRTKTPPAGGLQTPSILGLGLVDKISAAEILKREDRDDADCDGVSGVASWVDVGPEGCKDKQEIGRFGWKAQVPHLADFVCLALGGETGITIPDQGRGFGLERDRDRVKDPELSQEQLDELVVYTANLAAPARGGRARAYDVMVGQRLFEMIRCTACHVPLLRGAEGIAVELYSDLLLHDVNVVQLSRTPARGSQPFGDVRTPPLWGVGHTAPYWHDGRAPTLLDAIKAHANEGQASRDQYLALEEADQLALVAFLEDL